MGAARTLWLPGPAGKLEGAARGHPRPVASAVLAHPHPMYGGTLHNPVIFHADRELNRAGWFTLRFNFRGTGESEGEHDGQDEVHDVAAAFRWLRGLVEAVPSVLVGYSFGSWCAARYAAGDEDVAGLVAIGLPVRLYDVREVRRLGRPVAVIQGELDEFGGPDEVRAALEGARGPVRVETVPGVGHLFPGVAQEVGGKVASLARWVLETGTAASS